MRLMAKRDANEAQIVAYLRQCGMIVIPISSAGAPDLLCYDCNRWFALEVKSKKGRLTELQRYNMNRAPFDVVRSLEEAEQWYRANCFP